MDWLGVVVIVYLSKGIIDSLGDLAIRIVAGRVAGIFPIAGPVAGLSGGRRQRIGWWRHWTTTLLEIFPNVPTWPVESLLFRRVKSLSKIVDLRLRWSLEVMQSIYLVGFAVVIALLTQVSANSYGLHAACYIVVATTIAMPTRWLINGENLRTEFRRTLRSPILLFALIAVANFVALSISATILLKVTHHSPFQWESVWLETLQIWKLGHLSAIWHARPRRLAQILVALAALAVYALLLSQLWRPWLFVRTNDDRIEISIRLLLSGDRDASERWLQKIRRGDPKALPGLTRAKGLLALSAGEFALALGHARAMASLQKLDVASEDKDGGRWVLAEWAQYLIRLDNGQMYSTVVSYLIEDGITDACLATVAPTLTVTIGAPNGGRVMRSISRHVERARRLAEASGKPNAGLDKLMSIASAPTQLPSGMSDPPYPLALAAFEGSRRQFPEAAARLLAMRRPRRPADRIVRQVLSGQVIIMEAVQEVNWYQTRQTVLQEILGLLEDAENWPIRRLPFWLKDWLRDDIESRLAHKLVCGGRDGARALRRLLDFLEGFSDASDLRQEASNLTMATKVKSAIDVRNALRAVPLQSQPTAGPGENIIFAGPVKKRPRGDYHSFCFCVRERRRGRHRDIYVYIDKAAPKEIIAAGGRAVLEGILKDDETPPRIFIDSSGKVLAKGVRFRFWRVDVSK